MAANMSLSWLQKDRERNDDAASGLFRASTAEALGWLEGISQGGKVGDWCEQPFKRCNSVTNRSHLNSLVIQSVSFNVYARWYFSACNWFRCSYVNLLHLFLLPHAYLLFVLLLASTFLYLVAAHNILITQYCPLSLHSFPSLRLSYLNPSPLLASLLPLPTRSPPPLPSPPSTPTEATDNPKARCH